MRRHSAKGTCEICGKSFAGSGMTTHLKRCGVPKGSAAGAEKSAGPVFHVSIAGGYAKEYWMHLAVPAEASLYELDNFLRRTWLECCGHLSAFRIKQRQYCSHAMEEFEQLSMDASLGSVLAVGESFAHEYDFGSTTYLVLKVVGLRNSATPADRIQLLARNDAIEVTCELCKRKPATEICSECQWDGVGWMCRACAESHECGMEMCLPVVNSPRAGVCGYTGPAGWRR